MLISVLFLRVISETIRRTNKISASERYGMERSLYKRHLWKQLCEIRGPISCIIFSLGSFYITANSKESLHANFAAAGITALPFIISDDFITDKNAFIDRIIAPAIFFNGFPPIRYQVQPPSVHGVRLSQLFSECEMKGTSYKFYSVSICMFSMRALISIYNTINVFAAKVREKLLMNS